MKTRAVLSLLSLAAALLRPLGARADEVQPPAFAPPEVASAVAPAMPEPYQPPPEPYQPPPEPYETGDDASQMDWPQDVTGEEATVDSYDDGYDPRAYTQFQDDLAPYGDWIDDATYGRVWTPAATAVGADFTPYYTGGHWALTEFGWTWVSDWSWGWAPFHYGRWVMVSGAGWCWVPGTNWGPAWVSWRFGDGYVGWAALPPRGVSVAVTYGARSPWRFTAVADLGARRLRCLPMRDARGMFHRTVNVANDRVLTRGTATVHINAGPRYVPGARVERLATVAPHAFPQRTILPRTGASMSARPWIRAAGGGGVPSDRGAVTRPAFGRGSPGHAPPAAASPPRIYNPPRTLSSSSSTTYFGHGGGAAPRTFAPPAQASRPTFTSVGPRNQDATPARGAPSTFAPAPVYRAPRPFGGPPARNPAGVYNPPPRSFATPPAVSPARSFSMPPAAMHNPAPRAFSAPPAPRAPAQTFHQTYAQPQMRAAPSRSFAAPRTGGGPSFGGGHRR